MRVKYFAWVSERLNQSQQDFNCGEISLEDFVKMLMGISAEYSQVFSFSDKLCFSLNGKLLDMSREGGRILQELDEIAIYPPISGG